MLRVVRPTAGHPRTGAKPSSTSRLFAADNWRTDRMGAASPDGDRLDSPSPDGDRLDRLSRVSASANSRACVSSSDAGSGKGTDMDILLVGSGGREHALAWQLAQ